MSANLWASFLSFDKLDAGCLTNPEILKLMTLCQKLAEIRRPSYTSHVERMTCRRLVCTTAFDLGIDLMSIKVKKFHGGSKPAMGRGLLDVWNDEYKKRFGSTVGTSGAAEITRRSIVTKLAKRRQEEQQAELKALILENKMTPKELSERLKLPLPYVERLCQQHLDAAAVDESPSASS